MSEWREALIHWRCGLSPSERQSYGITAKWDCRDLQFYVGRINFEQLGPQRAFALKSIPTRFKLTREEVDTLIKAGQEALRKNPTFRQFVDGAEGRVATAVSSPSQ